MLDPVSQPGLAISSVIAISMKCSHEVFAIFTVTACVCNIYCHDHGLQYLLSRSWFATSTVIVSVTHVHAVTHCHGQLYPVTTGAPRLHLTTCTVTARCLSHKHQFRCHIVISNPSGVLARRHSAALSQRSLQMDFASKIRIANCPPKWLISIPLISSYELATRRLRNRLQLPLTHQQTDSRKGLLPSV